MGDSRVKVRADFRTLRAFKVEGGCNVADSNTDKASWLGAVESEVDAEDSGSHSLGRHSGVMVEYSVTVTSGRLVMMKGGGGDAGSACDSRGKMVCQLIARYGWVHVRLTTSFVGNDDGEERKSAGSNSVTHVD
jgi:hypothetical protein